MMVKCNLEKMFLKLPHAGTNFRTYLFTSLKEGFLTKMTNSEQKITLFPHGAISIKKCCGVSIYYSILAYLSAYGTHMFALRVWVGDGTSKTFFFLVLSL